MFLQNSNPTEVKLTRKTGLLCEVVGRVFDMITSEESLEKIVKDNSMSRIKIETLVITYLCFGQKT
jgi:hypothetical protein